MCYFYKILYLFGYAICETTTWLEKYFVNVTNLVLQCYEFVFAIHSLLHSILSNNYVMLLIYQISNETFFLPFFLFSYFTNRRFFVTHNFNINWTLVFLSLFFISYSRLLRNVISYYHEQNTSFPCTKWLIGYIGNATVLSFHKL